MAKDYVTTVRIQKDMKTTVDDRGHTVGNKPVESVDFELVSTDALEKILASDDGKTRGEIRRLVAGRNEGVLARDTATGAFQIVSDADLKKAFETSQVRDKPQGPAEFTAAPISEKTRLAADELSLVSTQKLRKILQPHGASNKDKFGGFDPYNKS